MVKIENILSLKSYAQNTIIPINYERSVSVFQLSNYS